MSERNFDLASFKKAIQGMIATNENAYQMSAWDLWKYNPAKIHNYTLQEIYDIIDHGTLCQQQSLSRSYFYKSGYYRQIILHYATFLTYSGVLVPNAGIGKNLSTPHISKKYYNALDYVQGMNLQQFFVNCMQKALIDGTYFGVRIKIDNKHFNVLDLPHTHCISRFKDQNGNDLIEFDISYFDRITDQSSRKAALAVYPKIISKAYNDWIKGKREKSKWVMIPSDIGICFPFFDGKPIFLSVIPKTIEYDLAVQNQREKEAEQIRKIIVQKIPHLADGRLVFQPDQAQEMHGAAVNMLRGNKNISVLTTYGDVDAIISKTASDNANSTLKQMENDIYSQAGVSGQIFATQSSSALDKSLQNDLALVMYLAKKLSRFITNIINELYSNSNISFSYTILPISHYNKDKYIDQSFKLSSSGYSFILPTLALGITQKQLLGLKDLQNDVMKLSEKLIPLQSSYTQSYKSGGRPTKQGTQKSQTTIKTEQSRQNAEVNN